MTIYSPYQDDIDLRWYVDVMTPNGPKKQNIINPLYYFQMMNVEPPVGSNFSDDTVEDFQDLCAEAEMSDMDSDYTSLEPYTNLNSPDNSALYNSLVSNVNKITEIPTVYMSINAKSISSSSTSLIPLTTPFVSIKSLNSSQTSEQTNKIKTNVMDKNVSFHSMGTDEDEYMSTLESSIESSSNKSDFNSTIYEISDSYDIHDYDDNNNLYDSFSDDDYNEFEKFSKADQKYSEYTKNSKLLAPFKNSKLFLKKSAN